MNRTLVALFLLVTTFGIFGAGPALAVYPEKMIRLVLPFPPAGVTDVIARILAAKLSEQLSQPVVIDSKPGANGIIGTDFVAKAQPDGYTLLLTNTVHTMNPAIYKKLPYNIERDFVAVADVSDPTGVVLVVNSALPVKSVKELIQLAKQKPNQIAYGSAGIGNMFHVAGEMFNKLAGVKLLHVPYKGGAQAITDTVGGQVQLTFSAPGLVLPHIRSGKLRAIAQTGTNRLPEFPDIPTLAESGLSDYYVAGWFGLFAPSGTPSDIVKLLAAETARAMHQPDVSAKMLQLGDALPSMSSEQFAAFVKADAVRAVKVARETGIDLDMPN